MLPRTPPVRSAASSPSRPLRDDVNDLFIISYMARYLDPGLPMLDMHTGHGADRARGTSRTR
jgi:hypothetical protein